MRVLLHESTAGIESGELVRALVSGLLVVVATSVVGTWVVLRGLTFLGEALAHGVIPGAAAGLLWGFDPVVGAAVSAGLLVGGVGAIDRRARLGHDASIGLLYVGLLSLGLVALSSSSHEEEVEELLFGDIAHVDWGDIALQAAAATAVVITSVLGYRAFLALSFNEDKAASLGLRPRTAHLAMLGLIAVAVVTSFRSAGSLLVFGLLVGPPSTALLFVRQVWAGMVASVLVGCAAVGLGLLLAHHLDTAVGATVAGTAAGSFFVALTLRSAVTGVRQPA